jgi:hypothetical protein
LNPGELDGGLDPQRIASQCKPLRPLLKRVLAGDAAAEPGRP